MRTPRLTGALLLFAAGAGRALASEGGGGASLIEPKLGTIFWTLLTFVLLMLLLRRFAWAPLLGALEQREKWIQTSIDQARSDRERAESMLEEQRQLVDQARRERAEALKDGQRDAEKLREEMLDEARRQRAHLLEQTEQQVQSEMRSARAELRTLAADLAIQAAEKLLVKNLDEAAQRRLVEDYLAELEKSGGSGPLPS